MRAIERRHSPDASKLSPGPSTFPGSPQPDFIWAAALRISRDFER